MQPNRALFATIATAMLAANALALPLAGTAEAATGTTVPSTIPADCSTDVSASLGAFLASVPSGADIEFPSNGCYRVETEIDIRDKSGWTLHGNGSLLKRTQPTPAAMQYPHANAFLRFINLSNSTISGLNILGINTVSDLSYLRPSYGAYDSRYPFDHGFAFEGATGVVLSNSKIDAVYGDGVYISGGDQYTGTHSNAVTVRNVTIDRNGRQGMSVSRSSDVLVDGVNIQHSRRSGIDLEPDGPSEVISNIEIKNSTIHSWLLAFASGGPGAVNNVNIHDNTVTGSGVPFVYDASTLGTARSNWQVVNNRVTVGLGSPQPAMKFAHTSGVVVKNNYVPVSTSQSRLEVGLTSSSAEISCNTFPGAAPTYVTADSASTFTAVNNSLDSTAPVCDSPTASAAPVAPPAPVETTSSPTPTRTTAPTTATPTPTASRTSQTPTASGSASANAPSATTPSASPRSGASSNSSDHSHRASPKPNAHAHASASDAAAVIALGDPPDGPAGASNAAVTHGSTWRSRLLSPIAIGALVIIGALLALVRARRTRIVRPTNIKAARRHPLAAAVALGTSDVLPRHHGH